MKTRPLIYLLAASLVATGRSLAADVATVTQSVNVVDHGSAQSTATTPAPAGTQIHDGEFLKTGASSRAELQFTNKTISRLGANTIFNYSASSNQVNLQAGTILFCKPKDGTQLNIKTEAVTAAIVGTTGFFQVAHSNGHTYTLFGLIEGKSDINYTESGKDPHDTLEGGQVFVTSNAPGFAPQIFYYNLHLLLNTMGLFKNFHNGILPQLKQIQQADANYQNDVKNGWKKPFSKPPFFNWKDGYNGPSDFLVFALDSAGSQRNVINIDGLKPPPTPPAQEECSRWCHPCCCSPCCSPCCYSRSGSSSG